MSERKRMPAAESSDATPLTAADRRRFVESVLAVAEQDPAWRQRFERSLARAKLHRGSSPNQVWRHHSMLRERFLSECQTNGATRLLASSCPPVAEALKPKQPISTSDVRRVVRDHGALAGLLLAEEAARRGLLKSKRALQVALDAARVEAAGSLERGPAAEEPPPSASAQAQAQAASPASEVRALKQEVKKLNKALERSKRQISQLTRKNQDLQQELAQTRSKLDDASGQHKTTSAALADRERETAGLKKQIEELKKAKSTLEAKLSEQQRLALAERAALLDRLDAVEETARAHEARALALERQLAEERGRRERVEMLVADTGLADLLKGLGELEGVIAALERFRSGITAYQESLAAEEQRRQLEMEELERRSAEMEAARKKQAEMEAAWRERELERRDYLERTIFGSPVPDVILIDGHNAVIRAFGREHEPAKRPWFVECVQLMARRLQEIGPHARIVLCFDTSTEDNEEVATPNLVVRYCDKQRGGADAAISELLEAGHPNARYLVISTDYKHVRRDVERARSERDSLVSSVDTELLMQYLATLEKTTRDA